MKSEVLICVVDPDASIGRSVSRCFQPEGYPVEFFASKQLFLNRKTHGGPCCLVVDAHLSGVGGLTLQQILNRERRTEQIIYTSGHGDIRICVQALKAGAVDFLTKPLKNTELVQAVKTALVRSINLLRSRKEKEYAEIMLKHLTPREREVLGYVIAGKINKEIAAELGTTEKRIKKQRGHLMAKLRVGSVAELVHFSLQFGLKPACPYGTKVPYTSIA